MAFALSLNNLDLKKLNTNELELMSHALKCEYRGTNKSRLITGIFQKLNEMNQENQDEAAATSSIPQVLEEIKDKINGAKTEILDAMNPWLKALRNQRENKQVQQTMNPTVKR